MRAVSRRLVAVVAACLAALPVVVALPAAHAAPPDEPDVALHAPDGNHARKVRTNQRVFFDGHVDPDRTDLVAFYDLLDASGDPLESQPVDLDPDTNGDFSGDYLPNYACDTCGSNAGNVEAGQLRVEVTNADGTTTGRSQPLPLDHDDPQITGYELVTPTRIRVGFSEDVFHPNASGEDPPSDWRVDPGSLPGGVNLSPETQIPASVEGTGDVRFLNLAEPLDRDATPRVRYEPTGAANTSLEPYEDAVLRDLAVAGRDQTALDEVPPIPPDIDQVAGEDASDGAAAGTDPTPTVHVADTADGHTVEVRRDSADGPVLRTGTVEGSEGIELTLPDLGADGPRTLVAVAEDPAGNRRAEDQPAVYHLDRVKPTPIAAVPEGDTITVAFSEPVDGRDAPTQWQLSSGQQILAVTGDDGFAPTRTLRASGEVPVGATLTWTPPDSDAYHDRAANTVEAFDIGVGTVGPPGVPTIATVAGRDAADGSVTANDPSPVVHVSDIRNGHTAEIYLAASDRRLASAEAGSDGADVALPDLGADGTYRLVAAAVDDDGRRTVADREVAYRLDTAPPAVQRVAAEGRGLTVFFSEPLAAGTDSPSHWSLSSCDGTCPQVLDVSRDGAKVVLDTSTEPAAGQQLAYEVTVGDRYRDAAGNTVTDFAATVAGQLPPLVSVSPPGAVFEGDSGTTTVAFPVGLSRASQGPVVVSYETRDGTATAGEDYQSTQGEVVFAPGETSKQVEVDVNGDSTDEPDETFALVLTESVGEPIAEDGRSATATIVDDDAPPVVQPPPPPTIDAVAGRQVGDDAFVTADEPAPVVHVSDIEAGDTAEIYLESSTVAAEGSSRQSSSESSSESSRRRLGSQEAGSGGADVALPDLGADGTYRLRAAAVDGGRRTFADRVVDYRLDTKAPTVVRAAADEGQVTVFVSEQVSGDDSPSHWRISDCQDVCPHVLEVTGEGNRRVLTTSTEAEAGQKLSYAPQVGQRYQDAAGNTLGDFSTGLSGQLPPLVSAHAAGTVTEGDQGSSPAVFPVVLSRASERPVVVSYETRDGTATAGEDYQSAQGEVVFAPGETSKQVEVDVNGDTTDEPDETFALVLTESVGEPIAGDGRSATATIVDDDPLPELAIADRQPVEGDQDTSGVRLHVRLGAASAKEVAVDWRTGGGTATPGDDYQPSSGRLVIPAGETSGTITVPIVGDEVGEPDETLLVVLSDPVNATVGRSPALVTIRNDDPPALRAVDVRAGEPASGSTRLPVPVTLTPAADREVTVDWTTAGGSAEAGSDFRAGAGTLTVPAGETRATIPVDVLADDDNEAAETFEVRLSQPRDATLADAAATVTIGASPGPSACPVDQTPAAGFDDTAGSVHQANIDCAAWYGLTVGVGDPDGDGAREYAPTGRVTRAQMASFVARLGQEAGVDLVGPTRDHFDDDTGSVHEDAINALAELGVVVGRVDGGDADGDGDTDERLYFPSETVSRAQMASYLVGDLAALVAADAAVQGGGVIRLDATRVAPGGRLEGRVRSHKTVTALLADGCGLDEERVTVADDGNFSARIPEDQPSGECELALTVTTGGQPVGADSGDGEQDRAQTVTHRRTLVVTES